METYKEDKGTFVGELVSAETTSSTPIYQQSEQQYPSSEYEEPHAAYPEMPPQQQ